MALVRPSQSPWKNRQRGGHDKCCASILAMMLGTVTLCKTSSFWNIYRKTSRQNLHTWTANTFNNTRAIRKNTSHNDQYITHAYIYSIKIYSCKHKQEALLSTLWYLECSLLFNSTQYYYLLLIYYLTLASGLPMCTIKFCAVLFGVMSWLSVINKIRWCVAWWYLLIMEDGWHISAITYTTLTKRWQHTTVQQYQCQSQVLVDNCDFCPS